MPPKSEVQEKFTISKTISSKVCNLRTCNFQQSKHPRPGAGIVQGVPKVFNTSFSPVFPSYRFWAQRNGSGLLVVRDYVCPGANVILSIAVKYIGGDRARSVFNLFLVLNMKVQRKVTPREVNSARAIGLIKGGMSRGVGGVARQCNVSRKPVNHY